MDITRIEIRELAFAFLLKRHQKPEHFIANFLRHVVPALNNALQESGLDHQSRAAVAREILKWQHLSHSNRPARALAHLDALTRIFCPELKISPTASA